MKRILLALVVVTLLALAPTAHADDTVEPTRVLLVGDSITQGKGIPQSGGYSWRYFLWGHVTGPVDLVGNKTGPALSMTPEAQDPAHYADPNFDYDHAGVAGAAVCEPGALEGQVSIGKLIATYDPDVVVEAYGINDLRRGRTVDQVLDCLDTWLAQARAAKPTIRVVISRLAWAFADSDGPTLNSRLTNWAGARTTSRSPVVLTQMTQPYDASDTYDGLHPHQGGEVKIAAMMASSLAHLGVPVTADPLPAGSYFPATPPAQPSIAAIVRQGTGIVVRWGRKARVQSYVLRCGGIDRTYDDPTYIARFTETRAVTCYVRAFNHSGSTYWSEGYRIAARPKR